MNFRDFILQLSQEELVEYAKDAKTTTGYLKSHLFYGYKEPRKNLRKALAQAKQVREKFLKQRFYSILGYILHSHCIT